MIGCRGTAWFGVDEKRLHCGRRRLITCVRGTEGRGRVERECRGWQCTRHCNELILPELWVFLLRGVRSKLGVKRVRGRARGLVDWSGAERSIRRLAWRGDNKPTFIFCFMLVFPVNAFS